ncbi:hypothetical protein [Streptomyces sp. NPDC002553]|uniref:hypothetical protein n=1 Tax=Streptomyces sp. NPDC002553 TaxID=3154417 RepID=UPI0033196D85
MRLARSLTVLATLAATTLLTLTSAQAAGAPDRLTVAAASGEIEWPVGGSAVPLGIEWPTPAPAVLPEIEWPTSTP